MVIRDSIGHDAYERLRLVLGHLFPGAAVGNDTLDLFVLELWRDYRPDFADLGVPPPPAGYAPQSGPAAPARAPEHRYYLANARHSRNGVPFSDFVGHLPVVRVTLALVDPSTIVTGIGTVERNDHLVFTVSEMRREFGKGRALGFDPERVDLVTPARKLGHRFGAVAAFLCYAKATDAAPSAYVLEGGLAQGGPRVLYPGKTMDTAIVQQTGYSPTESSNPGHWYHGTLRMRDDARDEPYWLTVSSHVAKDGPPYITISVEFQPVAEPPGTLPIQLFIQAGMRVAAIGNVLGQRIPEMGCAVVQDVMAALGLKTLDWISKPRAQ